MGFPFNDQGQLNSQQAIMAGVADVSANGQGLFRVSTLNSITATVTTSPLSADSSSVSAKQGDAANLRVSVIGLTVGSSPLSADSSSVSAKQGDASNLRISAFAGDAGLFRVSSIGGTNSPLSADSSSISAKQGDAANLRASAIIDSGSISAKSTDATNLVVSAVQKDAAILRVSAILAAGVSSTGAASFGVSAAQIDAGVLRISAIGGDANTLHTSAVQGDAALQRISAILAAGVSSTGAASFGVSAAQLDAGALHASAYSGDANQLHISAVQGDGSLLRVSSLGSVVTTNTGGASVAFVSSGLGTQTSTAKSTAGRLYGYHIYNPAGVDQFLQLFNTSAGAAGGDANYMNLGVPTLGGAVMSLGTGVAFSNGIQFVGTSTRNGNTMGASSMIINLFYA